MILVRPTIPGTATIGSGPDGIPIPSGPPLEICRHCDGPTVGDEWFVRLSPSYSGESVNVVALEMIWDKVPGRNCKDGVSHNEITNLALNSFSTKWQTLVKANPHRYSLKIGVVAINPGAVTFNVVAG